MRIMPTRRRRPVPMLGLLIMLMALSACNSNRTSAIQPIPEQTGDLIISLTDAEGDFASYTVDVISLTLTKANGAEVSTLPLSSRIDFAQYTDMTEFLTAATIPSGVYTQAKITLDYSNADIWVENDSGELVAVTAIQDQDGNPLSQVEMAVQLEGRSRLLIAPGIPVHLQLDFDLKATNTVSFDQGAATVTVDPYLIAEVNRVDDKIHRLRGLLDTVAPADGSFSVFIRPFYCALSGSHANFGRLEVNTDADTIYEINGESYQGAEGLAAMAGLDPLSAVVVIGDLHFDPLRFEAYQVYAGTSVAWGSLDIVSGSVTARTGDQMTVTGATLVHSDGSVVFHDQVTVTLGQDTRVRRQFSRETGLTTDDISVGQRVSIFGFLTSADPLNLQLDSTEGWVELKTTVVRGHVTQVDAGDLQSPVHLNLQSINQFRVSLFDFSGTGTTAENDASPADYEIHTGSLNLSDLAIADPVKVWGFVQPFGAAPQDFNAWTIVRVADVPALLKVHWRPPTVTAFDSISSAGLTLNLSMAGRFHHVFRAGMATELPLTSMPAVVPQNSGSGVFVLHLGSVVQVFTTFDDYINALNQRMRSGWRVSKIHASGHYDQATDTLTADLVDVVLM